MSLMQHIQEIMDTWRENFNQCQLVFYRATSGNKKVLFGAKDSAIEKNDDRLRSIPFQTRRATFKEVKRVHELLNKVDVLGKNRIDVTRNRNDESPVLLEAICRRIAVNQSIFMV